MRILKQLRHENVVSLIEVFRRKRKLYLVFEYVEGNLLEALEKHPEGLDMGEVRRIMWQLIRGVDYLHSHSVIHRDLKPANILINNNLFKICDFGFSKVIKDPTVANKTCVGSPIYMAPQILDKKDYSAKCDIWSLGIIMY